MVNLLFLKVKKRKEKKKGYVTRQRVHLTKKEGIHSFILVLESPWGTFSKLQKTLADSDEIL